MTSSTSEVLSHFLSTSDHIPKANRFGKPCIHPRKEIAVAVWALANQESWRQIAKSYHDQKMKVLLDLDIGQEVHLAPTRRGSCWIKETCVQKLSDR